MNIRQRTLIRSRCKNMNFSGYNIFNDLLRRGMPGKKKDVVKRYTSMLLRNNRKWREMTESIVR